MEKNTIRLNKFLANNGVGARRKISDYLQENEVKINGLRVKEPGIRLDPQTDQVTVNGKLLPKIEQLVYFLLNKPKGVISSVSDEHGRQTVVDLVKTKQRVYPIGRLDANTTGALLLTNDGDFAHQLTHPSFHINKTYLCLIPGKVTSRQIQQLQNGVDLKDGKTSPAEVSIVEDKNNRTRLKLTIHEGRNHQVKRMIVKVGLELIELKRLSIGELEMGDLPTGEFRELNSDEVYKLKS